MTKGAKGEAEEGKEGKDGSGDTLEGNTSTSTLPSSRPHLPIAKGSVEVGWSDEGAHDDVDESDLTLGHVGALTAVEAGDG